MRRMFSLLAAVLVLAGMAVPVFADGETFVPSITYKDGPEIVDAEMDGEDVSDCIVVTSILDAQENKTDISQETRDELLEVYEALTDGSMEIPYEDDKDYVVRELVDVSFEQKDCQEAGHSHQEELDKEGVTATVDFDLGVTDGTDVYVFYYYEGQWHPAERVENKGDGIISVTFENFCPVAFCIEDGAETPPAQTGDEMDLTLYIVLMLVSLVGIIVLVVLRHRTDKKK